MPNLSGGAARDKARGRGVLDLTQSAMDGAAARRYPRPMAQREPVEHPMTLEEYAALPDDDLYIDEVSRGRLVREPRPGFEHGRVQVTLASMLGPFVREHGLGEVIVESGFILARDPLTLRGSDVSFVSRARLGEAPPKVWAEFPPDLAVEILSPSDRRGRMSEKIAQYFAAGTRLVWLIDPKKRIARVHVSPTDMRVLSEDEELDGGQVVPGFRVRVGDLFD